MSELALVTGANRGLGLETARELARRGMRVVLAARDGSSAEREAAALRKAGHDARAITLDVTDPEQRDGAAWTLEGERLGALVSNAGIALDGFDAGVVRRTLGVNYVGATRVVRSLSSLLTQGSRVVLVSSGIGELGGLQSQARSLVASASSEADLDAIARDFEASVERGTHERDGWPSSAYRISKALLNAWTRLYAREVRDRGVLVNAVCPGWVRTDMGGPGASRSVAEGASGIVWAATLPQDGPSGGFFRDGHSLTF